MIYWLNDWPIDGSLYLFIAWICAWLMQWLIDRWLINLLNDWSIYLFIYLFIAWMSVCLSNTLIDWLNDCWLIDLSIYLLFTYLFIYLFVYLLRAVWVTEWVGISSGHTKPVHYYKPTFIRLYRTTFCFHAELAPTVCTALFRRTLLPSG